jgi:hypothetical protein
MYCRHVKRNVQRARTNPISQPLEQAICIGHYVSRSFDHYGVNHD